MRFGDTEGAGRGAGGFDAMNERRELKTIRMAKVSVEGNFLVHYAKNDAGWHPLDVDDAVTLEDARKLAGARVALGYRTKITDKKSGTQVF
jgi:hypothetical protein